MPHTIKHSQMSRLRRTWDGEAILTVGLASPRRRKIIMWAAWTHMDDAAIHPRKWWPTKGGAPFVQYIFEDFDEFVQWVDHLNLGEETQTSYISESDALRLNKEQRLWRKSPINREYNFQGLAHMLNRTILPCMGIVPISPKILRQRLALHGR